MQTWPWALFWGRGSSENDGRAMWRINLAQLEKLWLRTKTTDNSRDWPAAASTALYTSTTKHKAQKAKVRTVKVHTHIVQLSMYDIPKMLWNYLAKSVLKVGTTSSGYIHMHHAVNYKINARIHVHAVSSSFNIGSTVCSNHVFIHSLVDCGPPTPPQYESPHGTLVIAGGSCLHFYCACWAVPMNKLEMLH